MMMKREASQRGKEEKRWEEAWRLGRMQGGKNI